jgi:tetratricopeptide (TPR) repeat protein
MIDVPLYRTGIIEGHVFSKAANGTLNGVGGLRLQLIGEEGRSETIRTFSDGGFYSYGLIPGKYYLQIDPQQLAFIQKAAEPSVLEFEIQALSDGDYLEGLDFMLVDKEEDTREGPKVQLSDSQVKRVTGALELFAKAQELAQENQLEEALSAINRSLEIFTTDQGLALKGSIYYLMGELDRAWEFWRKANEKNPEIPVPNRE